MMKLNDFRAWLKQIWQTSGLRLEFRQDSMSLDRSDGGKDELRSS